MKFGFGKPVQRIELVGCPDCGRSPAISGEIATGGGGKFQWVYCPGCNKGLRVYGDDYEAWNRIIEVDPDMLISVV
jgi:hypothetical protein